MAAFKLVGHPKQHMHGLRGSALAYFTSQKDEPCVLVCSETRQIDGLVQAIRTYRPSARVFTFPPLDGSPFGFTPTHPSIRRDRLRCLDALATGCWDVVITTGTALLTPIAPIQALVTPKLSFKVGHSYNMTTVAKDLVAMGYLHTDVVAQPGDFAKRGGILDIYDFASETAIRLDFFDDELDEIRRFDPSSQRSVSSLKEATVLPLFEWLPNQKAYDTFNQKGGDLWNNTASRDAFLSLVAENRDRGHFSGYLHWTALFFDKVQHFPNLLPKGTTLVIHPNEGVMESLADKWTQTEVQAEALTGSGSLFVGPQTLYATTKPRQVEIPKHVTILAHHDLKLVDMHHEFITHAPPHYQNNVTRMLEHWLPQTRTWSVVLVCRTAGLLQRLEEQIESGETLAQHTSFPLDPHLQPGIYLTHGTLETGFSWPDRHLVVLSETDIWSKATKSHRPKPGKAFFQSEFRDLKIGDYVVHQVHGIGKFLGLVEMDVAGSRLEMMALEYKDQQKLYLNLNQLDLIQRHGSADSPVSLDKMGGVSWEKTKSRVKKQVREMAEELLKLYAARKLASGNGTGPDSEWQREFEDAFEHQPTTGQLRAIADIKADMERNQPMDRLLVGDVGFGKTEVAMRAAFKTVMAGRQVAVLCPTTVLAFQHFHTFRNRFAAFPVEIGWISRFTSATDRKKVLKGAADGSVDIVIGTHRLLSKDVLFRNLGALIIDEEQRFGVSHKEKLKQYRKSIDVLSMSATPIPRTLNMGMTGIRDISIIETPPRNRLAISTTVTESREGMIRNAVQFELERGGQVFFIHNRVETMETVTANLKQIVPNARITFAHGQMEPKQIEEAMLAFMRHQADILVASTIIENGVDIPNANTLIVNRADMFGMSQLYQLRGRIGRSDRPAYAYLLVPPKARMTSLARKRLATLEEFSDLGSGFRVAAMDMELRGAGSLLGGKQAGHLDTIGYEMYIKLLNETVRELKGQPIEDEINCIVNLHLGEAIPRDFIGETNQRLHYYKRLAAAKTEEDLIEIKDTMVDCYGELPVPAQTLYQVHDLRLFLSNFRVTQVDRDRNVLHFRFHAAAEVNPEVVLDWMRTQEGVSLTPEGVLTLPATSKKPGDLIAQIKHQTTQLLGD